MKTAILFAPAAALVVGFYSSSAQAHGEIVASVGIPPVVVDVGGVKVVIGQPPPPRQVVVVEQAPPVREVVYVDHHHHHYRPQPAVVIHERARYAPRETVVRTVYVDDDRGGCNKNKKHHGKHHGKHGKHDGRDDGRRDNGGWQQASYRR